MSTNLDSQVAFARVVMVLTQHLTVEQRASAAAELRDLAGDEFDVRFFAGIADAVEAHR